MLCAIVAAEHQTAHLAGLPDPEEARVFPTCPCRAHRELPACIEFCSTQAEAEIEIEDGFVILENRRWRFRLLLSDGRRRHHEGVAGGDAVLTGKADG